MDNLLSDDEIKALRSMSHYWKEVQQRDDQSPLQQEIQVVYSTLGASRLLTIISEYVNRDDK